MNVANEQWRKTEKLKIKGGKENLKRHKETP